MKNLKAVFEKFNSIKVGVIGDVMLDTYMWGKVDRISPEAPVPIVSLDKKEQRIGGAGNVALNLASLGAQAFIISAAGADEDWQKLNRLFGENRINTDYSFTSSDRITTNKIRIIGRNQQMMRLDGEITSDLNAGDEEKLIASFKKFIATEKPDIVILEDYNKGVLTASVIKQVIALCKAENILTAVDPKRKNFFAYQSVDIFKPNLKEAKEALNLLSTDVNLVALQQIHQELFSRLQHRISLITLSEKGIFYQADNDAALIPSHIRNIADVSGAGDTVVAVACLVYAASKDMKLMAEVANLAGGIVCEEVGTVAIDKEKLLHESELLLS